MAVQVSSGAAFRRVRSAVTALGLAAFLDCESERIVNAELR